jgi:hypothetical protein
MPLACGSRVMTQLRYGGFTTFRCRSGSSTQPTILMRPSPWPDRTRTSAFLAPGLSVDKNRDATATSWGVVACAGLDLPTARAELREPAALARLVAKQSHEVGGKRPPRTDGRELAETPQRISLSTPERASMVAASISSVFDASSITTVAAVWVSSIARCEVVAAVDVPATALAEELRERPRTPCLYASRVETAALPVEATRRIPLASGWGVVAQRLEHRGLARAGRSDQR